MKLKLFLSALAAICLSIGAMAQVPQQFAFQGVARNSNGQPAASQKISVRFTIHQGSESGTIVYQERHLPTTGTAGVFNVSVGGGTVSQGAFASIKWADAIYFLQVELDPAGGSVFSPVSTTQLLSVPYSLMTRTIAGFGSTTSGFNANTMGYGTKATGENALAVGNVTTASGKNSFAAGIGATASGSNSIAMGLQTTATADDAIAMGYYAEASGIQSVAIGSGPYTKAIGKQAVSIGTSNQATGDHSFVIGTYGKTLHPGAFIITDYRSAVYEFGTTSTADNQMTMRFGGGYRLLTSSGLDANAGPGVALAPNGNSWSSISDSTKKENYLQPNGTDFLSKIKGMKLGSWNYKGQDKQLYRHYGPMAQEFHSLFGNDGTGTIGNDTTIASADIDGVMMIALQALAKQVDQLSEANKKLQQRVQQLEATRKEK
ncbi:tail fiber domain-containing protein [Niabella sp.]|uniref:tail fiber domain-containing protein n=1 Tax=Niabella sp. TaxID=1962976 RepID=UPI002629805E|nr:tail fiber domain-containing protein [Niabella sp.]